MVGTKTLLNPFRSDSYKNASNAAANQAANRPRHACFGQNLGEHLLALWRQSRHCAQHDAHRLFATLNIYNFIKQTCYRDIGEAAKSISHDCFAEFGQPFLITVAVAFFAAHFAIFLRRCERLESHELSEKDFFTQQPRAKISFEIWNA